MNVSNVVDSNEVSNELVSIVMEPGTNVPYILHKFTCVWLSPFELGTFTCFLRGCNGIAKQCLHWRSEASAARGRP